MNKKAQGLSMNVIIIAAISILVLIILIFLVTGGFEKIFKSTKCEGAAKGVCADDCEFLEGTYTEDSTNSGENGGCESHQLCCIKVG